MDDPDRFDGGARGVLTRALNEAIRLDHDWLGTEHLLLALVADPSTLAGQALANLELDLAGARRAVETMLGRGDRPVDGEIKPTPRVRDVIELAAAQSTRSGSRRARPEHLLLAIVAEGGGVASRVLGAFAVSAEEVRAEVERLRAG
jgi:ATP-dependent Clp protease ATP-binding subunit ClpC